MTIRLALAVGAAAVLTAAAAQATTLDFSWSYATLSASWTQSSSPTVLGSVDGDNTDVAVTGGTGSTGAFTDVVFYNSGSTILTGGFQANSSGQVIAVSGPKLYTGSEAAPVFAPGVYALDNGTLTVTDAVPEPAAWSMMLVGVAGLGGMLRASRRRRLVAA